MRFVMYNVQVDIAFDARAVFQNMAAAFINCDHRFPDLRSVIKRCDSSNGLGNVELDILSCLPKHGSKVVCIGAASAFGHGFADRIQPI
jgi:hypothetical protein